ncbi:LysR family transcriptional regulator [Hansschlegelia quercus]|uniref:LysR family transcriptional regulator n=1 Tax=Hansschlegelia quercus TaxID=2528245 RepID=A0A4Q9GHD9_9HYPH|nr:LysR family transcriptional regulator [Hansschlegelia quercus]TBN53589.1 LysR family transcriptional regulator [Hansschlegelia quercus]
MLDRILGLQVFAKVAALGSLSGAARALGMSQTMATKHMAAVENRLGVRLVHRTTRRISLTEAGRRYLESVERILSEMAEADALAAAERVEVTGALRVNAPASFGVRELAPILPEFARLHPALRIELGLSDRVIDLVEEGWDVAVRIGRVSDQNLIARKLAPCRLLVAGSPAYLSERGVPRAVAELSAHNCLGYTLSSAVGPGHWLFGTDGGVRAPVWGNLQANNGDALVAAAVAGQGLIYQPTFIVADELRAGRLVAVSLDVAPIELPGIFAVYPGARRPPAKIRAFVDFLLGRYGSAPPWERGLYLPG